jgi:hypothetical protein
VSSGLVWPLGGLGRVENSRRYLGNVRVVRAVGASKVSRVLGVSFRVVDARTSNIARRSLQLAIHRAVEVLGIAPLIVRV